MTPGDPVVGSTVLRRAAIQSPNFVTTVSGWAIRADGTAEFNSLTIRGNLTDVTSLSYSSTPAAGNLVASDGFTAATTDSFGNHIVPGHATYATGYASSVQAGFVQFYTGSLAGGWTAGATIETDSLGDILILAAAGRSVTTVNNTLDNGSGAMAVTSLTVNGSGNTASAGLTDGTIGGTSSTAGLPDGTIHGTSGGASAGTAHTHSPGSFAVGNGVHSHGNGSYAVNNGTHVHAF